MNNEQRGIWNFLIANALGRANAIHMQDIADAIQTECTGTNCDNIRGWIKDMVIDYGCQIGTCNDGAFIILTDEEREDAASYLERNQRADAVRANGNYNPGN